MPDSNVPYLKLITSEYAQSKKFTYYVESFLEMISPNVDNYNDYNVLFDLETASGDQLDKIGELIGIGRELPTDNVNIPSKLSDDSYRLVIKAKIYKNHWDGTREGMEKIFKQFFPNLPYDIVDNQDMSYEVTIINPEITDELLALITEGFILPKPSGVRVNYTILDSTLFGWDSETQFIDGWDKGKWSNN